MDIKDGKYVVHQHLNGIDKVLGRFEIKDGIITFLSEADRLNIDQFPSGKMTAYTKNRIHYLMTDPNKDIYIKKL
jgi:hypothetical protein